MKSGGVRFADNPQETSEAVGALLNTTINGFRVEHVLVEERLDIASEIFLAATYDAVQRTPVLLVSRKGGIDVEAEASVSQYPFSARTPASDIWGQKIAEELGFEGDTRLRLGNLIMRVANLFIQWDALLLELNPVVLQTDGAWNVADVHLELDDDAALPTGKALAANYPSARGWRIGGATLSARRPGLTAPTIAVWRAD